MYFDISNSITCAIIISEHQEFKILYNFQVQFCPKVKYKKFMKQLEKRIIMILNCIVLL
ncbi:hypothetical protein pb186bvf_019348 [Paramecium bursaria]